MRPRTTHRFFHDVLGERFVPFELFVMITVAGLVASYVVVAVPPAGMAWWRLAIAWALTADVVAGCLANFTSSTNDYYAARPRNRWLFIAVHVHVVVIAWALGAPLRGAVAAWSYTIVAASIVNALAGHPAARFVAAFFLVVAIVATSWLEVAPPLAVVFVLFYVKVAYAFAVDHVATAEERRDGVAALTHRDRPRFIEIVSEAFARDALFSSVAGDDDRRREAFAGFLFDMNRLLAGDARGVFDRGRLVGVMLLESSERASAWRGVVAALRFVPLALRLGWSRTRWLNAYLVRTRAAAPREPHHYLVLLGVSVDAQGRGVGRRLVDEAFALARADDRSSALVLDTENDENVDLYMRWGFATTARIALGGGVEATVMACPSSRPPE